MMRIATSMKTATAATLILGATFVASSAHAVDGVIEINEASAAVGGITAGDTAGFPVTISEPGSYRLTSDLTVPNSNTGGILITASHVTVDLNGFTISGPGGTGTGDGVLSESPVTNVTVRNGSVRDMGDVGVRLFGDVSRAEDVTAVGNGGIGIQLGVAGAAEDCVASGNGTIGIVVSRGVALGNIADDNGTDGIVAGAGSVVKNNSISRNDEDGIFTASGVLVKDNTVHFNGFVGIRLVGSSGYVGNVVTMNVQDDVVGGVSMGPNLCDNSTLCS